MAAIPFPTDPARCARIARPLVVLLCTVVAAAPLRAQDAAGIDATREALARWTEAQRIISREKQDWRLGKQTLEARTAVARREIESLQARIADADKAVADADQERAGKLVEKEQLDAVSARLAERVTALEARVLKMLPRLPEPLANNIKPLTQLIPASAEVAAEKKMSLGQRFGNVIGALNMIGKWNREVTIKSEVRQLQNGQSVEVSVIYIGLGQAYYAGGVDQEGKATVGGIGAANATGWTWEPADAQAPAIQQAISIYKNEQLARLVRLPVRIQ